MHTTNNNTVLDLLNYELRVKNTNFEYPNYSFAFVKVGSPGIIHVYDSVQILIFKCHIVSITYFSIHVGNANYMFTYLVT